MPKKTTKPKPQPAPKKAAKPMGYINDGMDGKAVKNRGQKCTMGPGN